MMNNKFELDYKKLLIDTLSTGTLDSNRTDVDTFKLFNQQLNIDLQQGFPIVTGKKIFFNKALAEFKWIFEGRTDLEFLHDSNVRWWDEFAVNGKLGKIYGYQVRSFNGTFDQVQYVKEEIRKGSRRAIISLWNPTDFEDQSLPCCYTHFNFVRVGDKLNMVMNFRSSDLFLGLPYDIVVGALFLTHIANECNLTPSTLGLNLADAHIYESHKDQVIEYFKSDMFDLPSLEGNYDNYTLNNYQSNKLIKAELVK